MVDKKKAKKELQYNYQKNAHMMLATKNISRLFIQMNNYSTHELIFTSLLNINKTPDEQ